MLSNIFLSVIVSPVVVLMLAGLLFIVIMIAIIVKRYIRCPADKVLVIYGNVGGGKSAKISHGGAAFVYPIVQDFEFLDLTPIPVVVDLREALSKENIRINVPTRFMVSISTVNDVMQNAAERLLGLSRDAIHELAADIIFGQMRIVIASMKIEEIYQDREKFVTNISYSVEHELNKIGLKLININLTDINDDSGYVESLGKETTAYTETVNVYLLIPENMTGKGQIQITVQGVLITLDAVTEDLEPIKPHANVEVLRVLENNIILVKSKR